MSSTPYAPPAARVSDPPEPLRAKPPATRRAVACLWISVAIAILATAGQLVRAPSTAELIQAALTGALGAALLALIASKAGVGRAWAPWVYLAVYILGSFFFAAATLLMPQVFLALALLDRITAAVQFVLQTVALVLLFTPASRHWFAPRRASA